MYKLKERSGLLANHEEWENIRKKANYLTESIKKDPGNIKAKIALSSLYIQEARITGDYFYYDKAAMKYVDDVLKVDSLNFDGLTLKALLQMSQHHFTEGLATAYKAQKINPYSAFVYGIMVDGNIEMGEYDQAVKNSDIMVSLRPDLRSYSRISYLREIHGDYPGAIEAMKLAVDAGAPGDESTEWCRIQLATLYENTGNLPFAEMQYIISSEERPGYPQAMAGLSRIAMHKKQYEKALQFLQEANAGTNDMQFTDQMIDIYALMGKKEKADQLARELIEKMSELSLNAEKDESLGHYADRELAIAYLKVNDYHNALKHALMEYNRRPLNIDVNETVAWVYYSMGEYNKSLPYIQAALKTNCKNPTLLCRAGLIYRQTGNKDSAKALITKGLSKDPLLCHQLEKASRGALTEF